MKSILILVMTIALVYTSAMAHNPLTAKFELDATQNAASILNVYTSQTGLHQALIKHYNRVDFSTITEIEYKNLAVQYIKEHTSIEANNVVLSIGEGGIKLGNHQTDFKFLIENYPSNVSELKVHVDAFSENDNHHSAFWWKNNDVSSKVILSSGNDFQGLFGTGINNEEELKSTSTGTLLGLGIVTIGIIAFLLVFYRKRRDLGIL